ncbi:vq motif-containing protein 22-like [Abeliophyllum distichum]|uniref:Vq motif-containing protein 22-like n=1 Tax=Abeliophyllum distichum TaxID=126358 RepID=A0ABD1QEX3_9LAMI
MANFNENHSDWIPFYQPQTNSYITFNDTASDATIVTTTVTTPATATATATATSIQRNMRPVGGILKPLRKRSRSSRRTPTTLLNTDTVNFRAMVQRFTGGPSAVMGGGGFHMQYQNQLQQQNINLNSLNNNPGDDFLQRLNSSRSNKMEVSNGFVSTYLPPRSSSSN